MFNVEIACKIGLLEAILLEEIARQIQKNISNDKYFFDGTYWTYNSVKAFLEIFPYVSEKKIRNALKNLENKGVLAVGNYNEDQSDRTLWYTIADGVKTLEPLNLLILPKGQMQLSKRANEQTSHSLAKIEQVNDKKADKQAEELFEKIWKIYPNKKGKGSVSKSKKLQLLKIGEEQLTRAIERYVKDWKKESDWRKPQNGSTFFNSGYVDYLDENYKESETDGVGTENSNNETDNPFLREFIKQQG